MPELVPAGPGSPEWLAARRAGVTATDIVTICGLSSWDSQYSLFWRKLGQVPEVPDSDRFRLARELEPYVRERWAQEQAGPWHFEGCGLYRNDARPWQMATPDYLVGPGLDYREPLTGVLECKTWADADRHSWGIEGRAEARPSDSATAGPVAGDCSSETAGSPKDGAQPGPIAPRIPPAVRAQILWQMDVMDVAAGHVGVVFLPSGEFRSYVIGHASQIWSECGLRINQACSICADQLLMRAAGEEFMARLRLELPPPDPDSSAATLAAVRARFIRQPDKQAEIDAGLWEVYSGAAESIRMQEGFKRAAEIRLREQAGEASVLTVNGQPVARRVISDAPVKAHTRHQDYIRRIKQQGDDDE